MRLVIPIEPMGAVRMTGRGKWVKPAAQRYIEYKIVVGWEAKRQARLEVPIQKPIRIRELVFVMPIPKSRTRQVKPGDFHTSRPDIDNLFKGVTDALNGIIWEDDSLICEIGRQLKIYGDPPRIEIEIEEASA